MIPFTYFSLSETSSTLTFQLFRSPFFQPKLADIFPTYPAPLFKKCLQLTQILRCEEIFLSRVQILKRSNRRHIISSLH